MLLINRVRGLASDYMGTKNLNKTHKQQHLVNIAALNMVTFAQICM